MTVIPNSGRLARLFCCLILLLGAIALPLRAADPAKTIVADTIYRADGTTAKGTLLISWPPFSTADGKPVAAGSLSTKIGTNGSVNIPLIPTQGATPSGTAYKVVISLDDGASSTEYWAVPTLSPTTIAAIRSTQVPATVAMQVVSRDYVDAQLATAVRKNGDETITGTKTFDSSPAVPSPSTEAAAANKSYVDTAIAAAAPSASNVLDVNKGGTGTGYFTPARCVRVAADGNSLESASNDCGSDSDTLDGRHAAELQTRQNYDARDFGAKCDGTTDDRAAIQAAIDAASSAGGGTVLVCKEVGASRVSLKQGVNLLQLHPAGMFDAFGGWSPHVTGANDSSQVWTDSPSLPHNWYGSHLFVAPWAGGVNTDSAKSNYLGLLATMEARTPGQHLGVNTNVNNFSNGDTIQFAGTATTWGSASAAHDEGVEGITVQANQGGGDPSVGGAAEIATATVTAVNGSTVTLGSTTHGNTLGEGRPLIITTPAKVYSAGTITGISGTPPVVTGSGTAWNTEFGTGAKTNLCFVLDSEVISGVKTVVPVASIDSATQLTLNYKIFNVSNAWAQGAGTTGGYKIYKCGIVTGVARDLGSVTVEHASDFAVSDAVELALGYAATMHGAHIAITPRLRSLPNGAYSGIYVINGGTVQANYGIDIQGSFERGINFGSHIGSYGILFQAAPAVTLLQSCPLAGCSGTQTILQANTSTGGAADRIVHDIPNKALKIEVGDSAHIWNFNGDGTLLGPNNKFQVNGSGFIYGTRINSLAAGFSTPASSDGDMAAVRDNTHGAVWFGADATCYWYRNGSAMVLAGGCGPISSGSTALATNLNADMVDGKHAAEFPSAGSCTNQVVTGLNNGAAPTCGSITSAMLGAGSYRMSLAGYCTGTAGTGQVISVNGLGATAVACNQSTAPGPAGRLLTAGGTVKTLYINEGTGQKNGTAMTWTVYKNNVATALTCTVASGQTACNDQTHSLTVAAGEYLTIKSSTTASSSETLANVSVAMELWN